MTTRTTEQTAAATTGNHGIPIISNEKLLQLYITMVKCRALKESVRALYGKRKITGCGGAAVGQEAAIVGVTIDLLPEDTIVSQRRDLIAGIIKEEPLDQILASLFAPTDSHHFDDRLKFAIETSQANKAKKNGKIAVAFLGDHAVSSGSWHKAIKVAGAQQLPILFVCQTDLANAPEILNLQAESCGFPVITVDGSDAIAIYRVATEAIIHARKSNGPTLIECLFESTAAHDPILKMEICLSQNGLIREELKLEAGAFTQELNSAIEAAGKP
jgi:TPP-dependent pyruvate/acetoin dehydrogenase alpha subunit